MPQEVNAPAQADSTDTSATIPVDVVTPEQETQDFGGFINDFDKAGGKTEPTRPVTQGGEAPATNDPTKVATTRAPAKPDPVAPATQSPSQADLIRSAIDATAAATARSIQAAQPKPPVAPQREMTEAEFNAKYGIPQINEGTMQAILDADPKKGAAMLASLFKQQTAAAVRMANDLQQAAISEAISRERAQVQPDLQAWRQYNERRQEEARQSAFYTAHPDLAAEKDLVAEILDATQAKVAAGKLPPFKDEASVFQFIADATRKITTRMTPSTGQQSPASPASAAGQPVQRAPHQRTMATATSSARAGTGQKPAVSELESVMNAWDN